MLRGESVTSSTGDAGCVTGLREERGSRWIADLSILEDPARVSRLEEQAPAPPSLALEEG